MSPERIDELYLILVWKFLRTLPVVAVWDKQREGIRQSKGVQMRALPGYLAEALHVREDWTKKSESSKRLDSNGRPLLWDGMG